MSTEFVGRHRILVMGDEERERGETSRILGEAGYTVDVAATKADVVTLLSQHAYDLVLADLMTPDLNGPTLYELLKESCRIAPPVIFRIERGYTQTVKLLGGRLDGSGSFERTATAVNPPGYYPSTVVVPTPGCWLLTIRTGSLGGIIVFRAVTP